MKINPQSVINLIESTNGALDDYDFRKWTATQLRRTAGQVGWLGPLCVKQGVNFHIHPAFEEHLKKLQLVETIGLRPYPLK